MLWLKLLIERIQDAFLPRGFSIVEFKQIRTMGEAVTDEIFVRRTGGYARKAFRVTSVVRRQRLLAGQLEDGERLWYAGVGIMELRADDERRVFVVMRGSIEVELYDVVPIEKTNDTVNVGRLALDAWKHRRFA